MKSPSRKKFSARAYAERLLEYNGKCADCGCKVGGANGTEWDHIIALALGGLDAMENLQPLCKACHKAKTAGDIKAIRKSERQRQRTAGISRQSRNPIPGSKDSGWKRKIDGRAVRRT